MAQLIKLYDYISRYESKPFHYPSQYIRLKQDNWRKLQMKWEDEANQTSYKTEQHYFSSKKNKWNPFKQNQEEEVTNETTHTSNELPKTEKQLKQYFLNQLYPIQLKWATSTIRYESFTKVSYKDTEILKYFLQRFPDIYLLMYYPIFSIKNAPMEGEIILIGPFEIEIIHLIHKSSDVTIIATDDRKWTEETAAHEQKSFLSPVISLKRTDQIVKSILQANQIEMPVKKSIISQNNHILYATEPYQINIIGKRDYKKWLEAKKSVNSSLKSIQLKAMGALLKHCQTSAVRRPEWNNDQTDDVHHQGE